MFFLLSADGIGWVAIGIDCMELTESRHRWPDERRTFKRAVVKAQAEQRIAHDGSAN